MGNVIFKDEDSGAGETAIIANEAALARVEEMWAIDDLDGLLTRHELKAPSSQLKGRMSVFAIAHDVVRQFMKCTERYRFTITSDPVMPRNKLKIRAMLSPRLFTIWFSRG